METGKKEIVVDEIEEDLTDVGYEVNTEEDYLGHDKIDFTEEEKGKFSFRKVKSESEVRKGEIKKEIKKEKRFNFFRSVKNTLTSVNFYAGISRSLDFALNFGTIISAGVAIYYTLMFMIEQNPIMALVGCLITYLLVKVNEKIQ